MWHTILTLALIALFLYLTRDRNRKPVKKDDKFDDWFYYGYNNG